MRSRFLFIYHTCTFTLFFGLTASAALKTDTWNGGAGSWTNASNWSLNVVPNNNNGSNDQYVVNIDGGNVVASPVLIDPSLSFTVNQVVIDAGDSLTITNASTLTTTNGMTVNGTLTLASSGNFTTFSAVGAQTLAGSGQVALLGTVPSVNILRADLGGGGTLTIGAGMTIHGAGSITGDPLRPLINLGTITADTSNQTLTVQSFVNQGQISALHFATLNLNTFTNNGTITATGATLQLAGVWGNSGVISGDVSGIFLGGTFNTANVTNLSHTGGTTITINGTMVNTNATLALDATTGSWLLNGTIRGGTVSASGGAQLLMAPSDVGTLDAVTLNANLTVTNNDTLVVLNGLTNNAVVTLASSGNFTTFSAVGAQTLAGSGQVALLGTVPSVNILRADLGGGGTLTIGAGMTIHGAGSITGDPLRPLINLGTITADTSNQTLTVQSFVNQGQISALHFATLNLNTFTNNGTITATGATLQLAGVWGNSGVISGDVSGIFLGGTFNTANVTNLSHTGGTTITINGTMVNTNATLALDATTGSWLLNGTIRGGTVSASGGAQLLMAPSDVGTLDAVTLNANLTVTNNDTLVVLNGLTNNAVVTLASSGNFTTFSAVGAQTLAGSGQVALLGTVPSVNILRADLGGGGTLTIGAGMTIHGAGSITGDPLRPLINLGTITADTSNQTLTVQSFVNQGQISALHFATLNLNTFTNNGTITATGATLQLAGVWGNSGVISGDVSGIFLGGTFNTANVTNLSHTGGTTITINGTMVNTNATLALDATTGSWLLNGTIRGGTVSASGGAQLLMAPSDVGTLDAVTLNANLTVTNNDTLVVLNGLTNNAVVTLASSGNFTTFSAVGAQTLAGSGQVALLGTVPSVNILRADLGGGGTLTIGAGMTIHGAGSITGDPLRPLINLGTITADTSNQTLTVQSFVNQGQISALHFATLNLNTFTNNGTITATGATLQLAGVWGNSGVISGDVSGIFLGGTFNTANVTNLSHTGGTTITINGTMVNTNATLALDATTGSWLLNGTIRGGTVSASGGAQLLMAPSDVGTLDAVTLNANLTVTNNDTLVVLNGLTNNAVVTLASSGNFTTFSAVGAQTLAGSGQVALLGTVPSVNILRADLGGGGTLTIGAGMTIHGAGSITGDPLRPLINLGTITADTSNQTLTVQSFVNQGQMVATNRGILNLHFPTNLTGVVTIDNASTVEFQGNYVQSGGSTVLNGGQLIPTAGGSVLIQGGSLGGGGFVNAIVTNFGSIIPGPAVSALVFSSNLVLNASSVLNFQLGGTAVSQYGTAVLSNGVNLAGSLAITLVNGFVPAPGTSYTVLTSAQPITGGFVNATSGFRIQTLDGAGSFVYVQTSNAIMLNNFQINSQAYLTWAQGFFGCTNCPQSSEIADPDGDGVDNYDEFLWGTDPTSSASSVQIISIVRHTNDIVVTWHTVGGRTNILQAVTSDASGSYTTTNFVDIPPQTVVSGVGESTTNQIDFGGATNSPARYYRIRLVP